MSKRLLSRLGIGSAKVDLILEKQEYSPGEKVTGHFLLIGGIIEQDVKRIDCHLMVLDKKNGSESILDSLTILSSRSIRPKEVEKIDFKFRLPENLEMSSSARSYQFKTKLHFDAGVANKDQDIIHVAAQNI
ncbi:sporulation protein [Bacillus badius]|uniref:Sporulation-control protein n=1 Tax=Bacillus badius TaxID=1455 RepID=A0ABR5ATD2_BACBA|nr:sporulation protein [Bacillus badius]KIL74001.1 Sporulation-control protein [Bacillus badius]KIL77418.1 Sporulation-control protein [Bacillus badius]KZN98203.1 hypothetical protein A4244_10615 [Bacillus badius]KZR58489.1 hypothetical protein A3781_16470 [Bacillus badius]MED0666690.1 sporulation protein [Bacillus badius]